MARQPIINAHFMGDGIPVLIIHGWQMDSRYEILDFEPIFEKTTGYKRIYVDLPGMGTTPAHGIENQDSIYKHLVDFIDQVIGETKFLVIGTSCGGYLARALAQDFPTRIDGLLLRVPMVEPDDSKRNLVRFQPVVQNEEVMKGLTLGDRKALSDVLVQTPEYIDALRSKLNTGVLPAVKLSDRAVLDPIRHDPNRYRLSHFTNETPGTFTAPTMILAGRHDEMVGWRDSLRLVDAYPRATYVVLDRGVHGLPVDETGLFQSLVRDWLFRVNEWRTKSKHTVESKNP